MAAPAKSFTVIPDADIDPDSPLTTDLVTALRDNDLHLEEWLGKNYTAAVNHDHDNVNSKQISTTLQHIETKLISTAVQTVTFTGLDGDTDKVYLLVCRFRFSGAATPPGMSVRPNGLAPADMVIVSGGVSTTDPVTSCIVTLWADKSVGGQGVDRTLHSDVTLWTSGPTYTAAAFAGIWQETTTNITSLEVRSLVALGIGVGSSLTLYKIGEA